ncbi:MULTISPECIES: 3-isopropylmalate dehydratase large subunit [Dehalobacter]|jgi:3-isopropylmalate/(R)-2-methylmalate dehydratase large subunit|uniref:3-isopropylmalate dehydratase large subunit n=2 Tax=Dehalobacter restrictus TaxID=55583 RepID=A0A857DJJ4_9FIRM|nr:MULTISPECIES: 3-isopropylmalate dehydratase large subunit [Dehalobacter]AHF10188.1 3-isopropylmalate dehydratase large subunit [Dehalobacter restrictus DSM 9455]MCG1024232.1 3-isopropylmalate dehydratase large subunit [Dehalobacter sp.]MDJ0307165.1 3-isopropylmalate dehydratase large subunit [Dehalobacter sp.]OCZ50463.1 3-isopropylmalate dehydratase large subunit [Dehalobacter sp. TeCB1]QHA00778.1 3-isopropylmalate dehydratase large subunit [Dehalobacter restrictus]
MGMTISEKILAAHAGVDKVVPGEIINAKLDVVLSNDVTAPVAIKEFEKLGIEKVFDKEKIALVPDHFTPNKDIASAEQCKIVRDFARKHEVKHYWDTGRVGIEHCLLPEQGVVLPGDLIIGADSHTCTYGALGAFATGVGSTDCAAGMATGEAWFRVPETLKFVFHGTKFQPYVGGKDLILYIIGKIGVDGARYKAMEFTGNGIKALSMDNRLTMCNMAIEAGGKAGIIEPDEITLAYVKARAKRDYKVYHSDPDAVYEKVYEFDTEDIPLQIAFPHLPENTKSVEEAKGLKIDQVVIGSCTNGRLEDLEITAKILKGKKIHPNIRCLIFPGTQDILLEAMSRGWIQTMIEAGAAVSTPTCGPCLGGHMGILAKGERALSTTNRNFVGRMGHPESEVYLCNPAVAAASAICGQIVHPREVVDNG